MPVNHQRRLLRVLALLTVFGSMCAPIEPAFALRSTSQSKSGSVATDTQIASIRSEVAAINKNLSAYQQETKSIEGITVEGTEATYYSSGKVLKKIRATLYGETFRSNLELYFRKGTMIFAFEKYEKYEAELGSPVASVTEYRFYFSGSRTIRLLAGSKRLLPSGEEGSILVANLRALEKALLSAR